MARCINITRELCITFGFLASAGLPSAAIAQDEGEKQASTHFVAVEPQTYRLSAVEDTPALTQGPPKSSAGRLQQLGQETELLSETLNHRRIARREIAYQILNAVDAAQTISCLNREVCHELNPILGSHPSTQRIIGFKLATGGAHYLVTRLLQAKAPAAVKSWQTLLIAVQGGVVAWNMQVTF